MYNVALWKTGLYICGFPSGSTGATSQEIVLEYPRGYRAIGFREEKNEIARSRKSEGERDIQGKREARKCSHEK